MELYQLRTFIAVAEAKNLTRAADRLHTSQPAVSAQIKALEEELGLRLFERSAKGMRLSSSGQDLFQRAQQAIAAADAVQSHAASLRHDVTGTLRLGTIANARFLRLGQLLAEFGRDYPKVAVQIEHGISGAVLKGIRNGTLDAGFILGETDAPELVNTKLEDIALSVVGPAAWRARIANATWDELAGMPWVWPSIECSFHSVMERLFAGRAQPQIAVRVDQETTLKELAAAGTGLALLRADDAALGERSGELTRWPQPCGGIALSFIYRRKNEDARHVAALLLVVKRLWQAADTADLGDAAALQVHP